VRIVRLIATALLSASAMAPVAAATFCACNGNMIYIINPDTGVQQAAITTPQPYEIRSPKLAPENGQVFYIQKAGATGKRQVFRVSISGGEPAQLTDMPQNCETLDVSPDGRTVVFSVGGTRPRLWSVAPGAEPRPLTTDRDRAPDGTESWGDLWPAVGPDGKIAYYRVGKAAGGAVCDIYCIDREGRFLANLTDRMALEEYAGFDALGGVTHVDWSADGRYVVFALLYDDNGPKRDVFAIDTHNGNGVSNLTLNRPELRDESGPQGIYMFSLCPTSRLVYCPHIPSPGLLVVDFLGDRLGEPRPLTAGGTFRWPHCAGV
jgi:Tol biopolymer transport system component